MSLLSYLSGIFPDFFLRVRSWGSSKPQRVRTPCRGGGQNSRGGILTAQPLLVGSDATPCSAHSPLTQDEDRQMDSLV